MRKKSTNKSVKKFTRPRVVDVELDKPFEGVSWRTRRAWHHDTKWKVALKTCDYIEARRSYDEDNEDSLTRNVRLTFTAKGENQFEMQMSVEAAIQLYDQLSSALTSRLSSEIRNKRELNNTKGKKRK